MYEAIQRATILELVEALQWLRLKSHADQLLLNPTKAMIIGELHLRHVAANHLAYGPQALQ